MNSTQRAELAQATLEIIDSGIYEMPDGSQIDTRDEITRAISGTIHYAPEDFSDVRAECEKVLGERDYVTRFQVVNSTTFAAAKDLTFGQIEPFEKQFASES